MQRLTFDDLFALLSAATSSSTDLARLREWIAGIAHPAECLALERWTLEYVRTLVACRDRTQLNARFRNKLANANTAKKNRGLGPGSI
jgi:hypothetical protein